MNKFFPSSHRGLLLNGALFLALLFTACNINEEITTGMPPKILLDSETGIYTVKVGREITIAPNYESAEGATYYWTMNNEVIGTSPSLTFISEEIGEYYIVLTISTDSGTDSEEIRVDVVELEIPTVSIAGMEQLTIAVGTQIQLNATVRQTSLPTTIAWHINGEQVAEELSYTFIANNTGAYTIVCSAHNEDGTHSDSVQIAVVNADELPFVWEFAQYTYHTVDRKSVV